ncbi:fungal specific transcription factor domain-containing protein [Sarocladium implicatum]|nr:fungal specific transcription factor domain-containing protein [Sarocladium implicatum]
MASSGGVKKAKSTRAPRPSSAGSRTGICKTCTPCRQKKMRCDGTRPHCDECVITGYQCSYPQDARSQRPTRARVEGLERTVATLLNHMRAAGIEPPSGTLVKEDEGDMDDSRISDGGIAYGLSQLASTAATASPLPTLARTTALAPSETVMTTVSPSLKHVKEQRKSSRVPGEAQDGDSSDQEETGGDVSALSANEARVAGVFHEHGCVSTVHGLAGILNPTSRETQRARTSALARRSQAVIAASKARLISNAAVQKQREARLFAQPRNLMDLDGCDPELAKHLIQLHFNRQHYAYLVSYRPAIMESLGNGDGKWCNKLLLNAIFYSCAIYSDRECLRSDPNDPQSVGKHFYDRIRQLLVDEIDKPSIPSAVALLLTSATLVSQGRSSAGWSLSGTAFRMILDMGCHMMLGPDYQNSASESNGASLRHDLEQEMRKRLYWSAYITDATQALYLGRPCMLASVEARVPLKLLDTYEELEEWAPFIDPASAVEVPAYASQPAYAVSTFVSLVKLFQISTRITELYGVQSMRKDRKSVQEEKLSIEAALATWRESLPEHLRFDPASGNTPPPHQITPHTTFHVLTILLHRAFLDQGHLRNCSLDEDKITGKRASIDSALMIQKYVKAYRDAFTLRRAPFLLSYAIYSAVTVIVQQERHERGQFTDIISFFWTCLSELQRGCNFGLKKPLAILKDMVREFQASIKEGGAGGSGEDAPPGLDETFFFTLPMSSITGVQEPQAMDLTRHSPGLDATLMSSADYFGGLDQFDPMFEGSPSGLLDFVNDQEKFISDDALYGLFAADPFS